MLGLFFIVGNIWDKLHRVQVFTNNSNETEVDALKRIDTNGDCVDDGTVPTTWDYLY